MRSVRVVVIALLCSRLLAGNCAVADEARGATWQLGRNVEDSFIGRSTLASIAAAGMTWALIESNVDADVQQWSARQSEGWSIGLALPGLALGWFAPAGVPLLMRWWGDSERTRNAASAALQSVGIALVTTNLLKAVTGRHEPVWNRTAEAEGLSRDFRFGFWRRGVYNGWPSGHTTTNMALAAALSSSYPESIRIRLGAYAWATYVAASATLGFRGDVHWLSDAVAGGLIGWMIGRTVGSRFAAEMDGTSGTAGRETGRDWQVVARPGGLQVGLRF